MRTRIAIVAALFLLLAGGRALTQASPVPFNAAPTSLTTYVASADAGTFGYLSVLGGIDGGLNVSNNLQIGGAGGTAQGCLGYDSANTAQLGFATGACSGGFSNSTFVFKVNGTDSYFAAPGGNIFFYSGASFIGEWNTSSLNPQVPFKVESGSSFTNLAQGTCTLSSGICNAVTAGTGGSSHCVASITSSTQTNLGCNTIADAGATTVYCAASATGTADVFCWN